MTTAGQGQPIPTNQLSYAEATAELDRIIAEFEEGQVDVDRLAARFQRATELVEELDRRIRTTRRQVDSLSPRLEAVARGSEGPGATPVPSSDEGDGAR